MAATRVQSKTGTTGPGATLNITFDSNVTAGNLITAQVSIYNTTGTAICTVTGGGTWTTHATAQNGANSVHIASAQNATGGATTVTITITGSSGDRYVTAVIEEWSGVPTTGVFDVSATNTGSGTAVTSGTTAAKAQANELVLSLVGCGGDNAAVMSGFSTSYLLNNSASFQPIGAGYKSVNAAGTESASTTLLGSDSWAAAIATFKESTASGYTIAANGGSFTLTGDNSSLEFGRAVSAAGGTYALTGADVTLTYQSGNDYTITADGGSYTLTGAAASLERGWTLTAEGGTYTLTGADALRDLSMVAAAGSYTLTGADVTLTYSGGSDVLNAEAGTYTLTGADVSLEFGRVLTAAGGAFSLTGVDASLERGWTLTADGGAYTYTGGDASLEFGRVIAADAGSYALTGADATLTYFDGGYVLNAEGGSFSLTGRDADLLYSGAASRAAGSNKRRARERYIARFKGEDYEFGTLEDLEEFVQRAQEKERQRPKQYRKPIKISLTPAFVEETSGVVEAQQVIKAIQTMPPSQALQQIRQIEARLKRTEEEDEDDEVLLWLI